MYENEDQAMWQGSSVLLEPNDLFVITQGEMIHPGGMTVFGSRVPPRFDPSFQGVVFRALDVCETMVAAKAEFPHGHINRTVSIDVSVLGIQTVTPRYLACLLSGRDEDKEAKEQAKLAQGNGLSLVDLVRGSTNGPQIFIERLTDEQGPPDNPENNPGNQN